MPIFFAGNSTSTVSTGIEVLDSNNDQALSLSQQLSTCMANTTANSIIVNSINSISTDKPVNISNTGRLKNCLHIRWANLILYLRGG